jgi:hypothetical protein
LVIVASSSTEKSSIKMNTMSGRVTALAATTADGGAAVATGARTGAARPPNDAISIAKPATTEMRPERPPIPWSDVRGRHTVRAF